MRHLPRGLLLASVLAGNVHAFVATGTASAGPAVMPGAQEQQQTERSVSLVIRVKPDQLKRVAGDLAKMVQGGESLGLPWLKDAFGAISAEIVVEDAAASGATSTAFRASSAGWVGPGPIAGTAAPAGQASGPPVAQRGGEPAASGAARFATAASIIGRHASAIRDGASALLDSLPADQSDEVRRQLEQLTVTAGAIGQALEGTLPIRRPGETAPPAPKR